MINATEDASASCSIGRMSAAKSTTGQALVALISKDPMGVRDALADPAVLAALSGIGIPPPIKVLALHVPHPDSRKSIGLGKTLCGKNGTRHANVTCKDCLNRVAKGLGPPKP